MLVSTEPIPEEEALAALNAVFAEHIIKLQSQDAINWVILQFKNQHYQS